MRTEDGAVLARLTSWSGQRNIIPYPAGFSAVPTADAPLAAVGILHGETLDLRPVRHPHMATCVMSGTMGALSARGLPDGATDAPVNGPIRLRVREPCIIRVDGAVSLRNVRRRANVAGTTAYDGKTVTFTQLALLVWGATYKIVFHAKHIAFNDASMSSDFDWRFSTKATRRRRLVAADADALGGLAAGVAVDILYGRIAPRGPPTPPLTALHEALAVAFEVAASPLRVRQWRPAGGPQGAPVTTYREALALSVRDALVVTWGAGVWERAGRPLKRPRVVPSSSAAAAAAVESDDAVSVTGQCF